MKKNYLFALLASMLLLMQNSFAGGEEAPPLPPQQQYSGYPGYYLGFQLGADYIDATSVTRDDVTLTAATKTGFAGRIYGGYKFTPHVAVEIAYASLTDYTYNLNTTTLENVTNTIERQVYFFDVSGKFILPLQKFYLYTAPGVAAVVTKYKFNGGGSRTFALPKLEAGFGINLTHAVSVGLSYSYIFGTGTFNPVILREPTGRRRLIVNTNSLPNLQMLTLAVNFDL